MWSTTPSFAVTLLFVGVGLCTWLALGRPALEEVDTREMYVSRPFSADKKCWVLNHLNKAGGSTLKYMLKPWIQEHNVSAGLYDSPQWSSGKNVAQEYLSLDNTLTWGAYTEGLRPYGADNCKWFTIFRQKSVDGLCAQNIVKATDIDLTTFARHWGNYGLRQFALAFVLPEAVFSAETDDNCKGDREDNRCSGWYRLKLYLDNLETDQGSRWSEEGQESFSTLAMYNLLKPAQELLNSKYAAVGLLEDWDNTMLLFNPSLELPNFDWPRSFRDIGKKNKNEQFHMEHSEALAMAWTDPEIRKYIALDIILYDFAVSVHDRQIQEYGLAS